MYILILYIEVQLFNEKIKYMDINEEVGVRDGIVSGVLTHRTK